jgi:hypothetical protein
MSLTVQAQLAASGAAAEGNILSHARNSLLVASPSAGTPPKRGDDSNGTITPWAQSAGRDIYRIKFVGAELAMVAIAGDGASNLDLYVFDERGGLVCRAAEPTDRETCTWTPTHTADFFVEVRNLGSALNEYRMWTN